MVMGTLLFDRIDVAVMAHDIAEFKELPLPGGDACMKQSVGKQDASPWAGSRESLTHPPHLC